MRSRRRILVLTLDDVRSRLSKLAVRRDELASALSTAADRLRAWGERPDIRLIESLRQFRSDLLELARQLGMSGDEHAESLATLSAAVDRQQQAEQALSVLTRALEVRAVDGAAPDGLQLYLQDARELADAMRVPETVNSDVVERLARGEHALCAVLRMIDGLAHDSDVLWADTFEVIRREFGWELAAAAARGRLRVDPSALAPDAIQHSSRAVEEESAWN